MELTALAPWLDSTFAGFDQALLGVQHNAAVALGGILTPLMKIVTLLGEKGILFFLAAVVLALFPRTRKLAVCMFGAVCCGALITNILLKDNVARLRPFESVELYRQWWQFIGSPAEDGFSFPSGHVTAAAAGCMSLILVRGKRWILPGALWVALMAVSRNYLMAHYPSDVLAAAIIGVVSALIAYAITLLIFRILEDHDDLGFCAFCLDFDVRDFAHGHAYRNIRRNRRGRRRNNERSVEPAEKSSGGYKGKHER